MRRYIVTLSSIPPRFPGLKGTLESLLNQTVKPEKVIVYLSKSYNRFPDWDGTPPDVPDGVEIRYVPQDLGPATKILPALRDFAGQDIEILFCDDDQHYQPHLAEMMLKARELRPDDSIGASGMQDYDPPEGTRKRKFRHRPRLVRLRKETNLRYLLHIFGLYLLGRITGKTYNDPPRRIVVRAGYADGFEGYMGVMVRPDFFSEEVYDIPEFARPVDDVWLSGHATRMGHPPWIIGGLFEPVLMPHSTEDHDNGTALYRSEFGGVNRDQSNIEVVRYFQKTYGLWH